VKRYIWIIFDTSSVLDAHKRTEQFRVTISKTIIFTTRTFEI